MICCIVFWDGLYCLAVGRFEIDVKLIVMVYVGYVIYIFDYNDDRS